MTEFPVILVDFLIFPMMMMMMMMSMTASTWMQSEDRYEIAYETNYSSDEHDLSIDGLRVNQPVDRLNEQVDDDAPDQHDTREGAEDLCSVVTKGHVVVRGPASHVNCKITDQETGNIR